MEDLSNRGTCVDVFSSLTAQQCKNVAKEIAHLQACFDFMTPEQKNLIAKEECVHTAADKQQFLEEFLHKIGKYGQGKGIFLESQATTLLRIHRPSRKAPAIRQHSLR